MSRTTTSSSSQSPDVDEFKVRAGILKILTEKIPNLTKNNFEDWRNTWLQYRDFCNLPEWIFDLSAQKRDDSQSETLHEKRGRICTFFALSSQISGKQYGHLEKKIKSSDAQLLWRRIHAEFRETTISHITTLETKFFNLSMASSGLPLKKYGREVQDQAAILNEVAGNTRIQESQEITVYLNGLHEDFKTFRVILLMEGMN